MRVVWRYREKSQRHAGRKQDRHGPSQHDRSNTSHSNANAAGRARLRARGLRSILHSGEAERINETNMIITDFRLQFSSLRL
jgi:hypothetical protein